MSMKKTVLSVFAATALSLSVAGQALAGGILVVDQARVVKESEVGKHVARQLETIGKTMSTELKAQQAPLKSSSASLAELNGKSMQEAQKTLQARPDLQKKYAEYLTAGQKVATEAKVKNAELMVTEQKALGEIAKQMTSVIETIAKERGADVVLDKSQVIYGAPVDITDTVISRLNSTVTRVSVVRERLPRKQAGK